MISIIMPCYNVENELDTCIESILKQTYTEFELIAIDDGSKDGTFEKLKEYQKRDTRIKAFTQRNAGPSSTRNRGIELAKGDYIAFCDSDDYIGEQYLKHLVDRTNKKCDIVIAGFNYVSVDGEVTEIPGIDVSCEKEEFCTRFYADNIARRLIFGPVNKLYRRELLLEKNIRFDTQLKIREDGLFVFDFLKQCTSFEGIANAEYYYVQHAENTSLISKLNENELNINARFYKAMVEVKESLTSKDVEAICPMFLNMDIALIKKYYSIEKPSFTEGLRFIRRVHKDTTYREARKLLRRYSLKKALRYYCPPVIEALEKSVR